MATLTLGDGRESIVKADRALKEGGQVRVTAPRSSCGQKQPNNQSTVTHRSMSWITIITLPYL